MSRIINPGAGDYADRLTILTLKILYGEAQKKDIKHFRDERNAILVKLTTFDRGPWLEPLLDLAGVNAALWQAEDELRTYRDVYGTTAQRLPMDAKVAQLALRIQALNDQRAALVATINQKAGDPRGEEKV